jgi:hypothetical protein
LQRLAAEGHDQVLLALSLSYPSSDLLVARARDALLAALPDVASPYSYVSRDIVAPIVSHSESFMYSSAFHTPVSEGGRRGYSSYLCPFIETKYNKYDATQYLKYRIDRRSFLYKLSHRVLICDCCLQDSDCWARILQNEFCLEFNVTQPDEIVDDIDDESDDGLDVEKPERNAEVVSSGLQPTRKKLPN